METDIRSFTINGVVYPNINDFIEKYMAEYFEKTKKHLDIKTLKFETSFRDSFLDNYNELLKLREWYTDKCGLNPDQNNPEGWSTVNRKNKEDMEMLEFRHSIMFMIKDLFIILEGTEKYVFPKGEYVGEEIKNNNNVERKFKLYRGKKTRNSRARYTSFILRKHHRSTRNSALHNTNNYRDFHHSNREYSSYENTKIPGHRFDKSGKYKYDNKNYDIINEFATHILEEIDKLIGNGIKYIEYMEVFLKSLFFFTYGDMPLSEYYGYREDNFETEELEECFAAKIVIDSYDTPYLIYPITYLVNYKAMNSFMLAPVVPIIQANTMKNVDNTAISACAQIVHDIATHGESTHGIHNYINYMFRDYFDKTGQETQYFIKLWTNLNIYCNPEILKALDYNIANFKANPISADGKLTLGELDDDRKKFVYAFIYHKLFHESLSYATCAFNPKIVNILLHLFFYENEYDYKPGSGVFEYIGNNISDVVDYLKSIDSRIIYRMDKIISLGEHKYKGLKKAKNLLKNALRPFIFNFSDNPGEEDPKKIEEYKDEITFTVSRKHNPELIKKIIDLIIYCLIYKFNKIEHEYWSNFINQSIKGFKSIKIKNLQFVSRLDIQEAKTHLAGFFQNILKTNFTDIDKNPHTANPYINTGLECRDSMYYTVQLKLYESVLFPERDDNWQIVYSDINDKSIHKGNIKSYIKKDEELVKIWEPETQPSTDELLSNPDQMEKVVFSKPYYDLQSPEYAIYDNTFDTPPKQIKTMTNQANYVTEKNTKRQRNSANKKQTKKQRTTTQNNTKKNTQ